MAFSRERSFRKKAYAAVGLRPSRSDSKWRSEKNTLSVAASIFPVRLLLWGLKGASSPFLVDPARRNRCDLAALNARHLLRKPVCGLKASLGLSCPTGTAVLSGSLLCVKREHIPRLLKNLKFVLDKHPFFRYNKTRSGGKHRTKLERSWPGSSVG